MRPTRQRPALLSLLVVASLSCSGTDDTGGDGDGDLDFDHAAMLDNIATNIVVPTYETFAADVDALSAAVSAYCAALGTAEEADRLGDARTAWTAAIQTWQWAEMLTFGPAHPDGGGFRDLIYSYPLVSACAVDSEVMAVHNDPGGYDISAKFPNRRGLDAVEYALFSASLDSVCDPALVPDGWDALADADKRAARCAYAERAAADLALQATALHDAWRPGGGDFAGDLASAGQPGSSFETVGDGVDAAFGGLFYLDTRSKDEKLARPAGLLPNSCGTAGQPCVEARESRFASRSRQNLAANLEGFQMLFHGDAVDGTEGLGFDDLLRALGRGDLADQITGQTAAALAAIDGLSGTLAEALEADYQSVLDAHEAVRQITTPLKSEVVDVTGLTIPDEAGGDTD